MEQLKAKMAEYASEQSKQLDKLEQLVKDMRYKQRKQKEVEAEFSKYFSQTTIIKEWKPFRRYKDGAEFYEISQSKFEQFAKDAGALIKIDRVAYVDCTLFEEYIRQFRVED